MKKIKFKYYSSILFIALAATSCKKVIDLDLGNNTGKLVIEGNITNTPGPQYIKLSRNVPFTNTNTYPAVTGANVVVKDDKGNLYQFTESPAGTYTSTDFTGRPGYAYTLSVLADSKTYNAASAMPRLVVLDSISAQNDLFDTGKNKKRILVHFQDPKNIVNQYRFVMYVNGVQVKEVFAFNDDLTDGKHIDLDIQESDIDIYPNDTVKVEMECIDKPIYTYWFTLMQQQADNNPGGAVAPSNPPTNITPATLGYFSAHTSQSATIVVK